MKISVITMIRNEADILPSFLAQLVALFDHAYVLDHKSTDGSSEIIAAFGKESPVLESFSLEFSGYHQKEVSDLFMERAFTDGADLVFFLDADEFLDVEDPADFRKRCEALVSTGGIGQLSWRNSVPVELSSSEKLTNISFPLPVYVGKEISAISKVAVTRSFYTKYRGKFGVAQGNHSVVFTKKTAAAAKVEPHHFSALFHLPIRSLTQLETKVTVGALSYLSKADFRPLEGFHWFDMLCRVAEGNLTPDIARGIVARYSTHSNQANSLSVEAFKALGFEEGVIPAWGSPVTSKFPEPKGKFQIVANAIVDFSFDSATEGQMVIQGKKVLLNVENRGDTLPAIHFRGSNHVLDLELELSRTRQQLNEIVHSRTWKLGCRLRDYYHIAKNPWRKLTGN